MYSNYLSVNESELTLKKYKGEYKYVFLNKKKKSNRGHCVWLLLTTVQSTIEPRSVRMVNWPQMRRSNFPTDAWHISYNKREWGLAILANKNRKSHTHLFLHITGSTFAFDKRESGRDSLAFISSFRPRLSLSITQKPFYLSHTLSLFLRWLSQINLRVSLWSRASSTPLPPPSPPRTNPSLLTRPCSVLLLQQAPKAASRLRPGTSSFRRRASPARSRCTRRPSTPPVPPAVFSAVVSLTRPSLLSISSSAICRSDSSRSLALSHFQFLFLRFDSTLLYISLLGLDLCVYQYLSVCVYIELVFVLKLFFVFLDLRFHFQVLISLYRSLLR